MRRDGVAAPLLSICIPTYNRAPELRNLLTQLCVVRQKFGDTVEFCISDNCSTDSTSLVIAEFTERLQPKMVHQASNLGGTLNIIAVTQLMGGEWGILVGDDDELGMESLERLLSFLGTADHGDWVLVDSTEGTGSAQYFQGFEEGRYTKAGFRRLMLRSTLQPFGFMGVHVFPRSELPVFRTLTVENSRPWPHVAAMLRFLTRAGGGMQVCSATPVMQAQGGAKLFWSGGDLARIRVAKLSILRHAFSSCREKFWFFHVLMLRELYSTAGFVTPLSWKLYEPQDFNQAAIPLYVRAYASLGILMPVAVGHALLLAVLRLIPSALYESLLRLAGKGDLKTRYLALKDELGGFDGIKRGI